SVVGEHRSDVGLDLLEPVHVLVRVDGLEPRRLVVFSLRCVGRAGEGHVDASVANQLRYGFVVATVSANDAVRAKEPDITGLADGVRGWLGSLVRVFGWRQDLRRWGDQGVDIFLGVPGAVVVTVEV